MSSAAASLLSPPRGVRPPRLSFECGTLLAGADAAAYLRGLGVVLPASGASAAAASGDQELIVNVGTFEAAGAVFGSAQSRRRRRSRGEEEEEGSKEEGKEERLRRLAAADIPFSEPARLSPSDPGYDPDFDS